MTKLIKSDIIKVEILKQYKVKNVSYTASTLSNILNKKFETIKNALEFFSKIGVVEKDIKEHGSKTITYYNLTEVGEIILNSFKMK